MLGLSFSVCGGLGGWSAKAFATLPGSLPVPLPWLLWGAGHVQASSTGLPGLLSLLSSAYIPGTGTGLLGNKMLWHPSKALT